MDRSHIRKVLVTSRSTIITKDLPERARSEGFDDVEFVFAGNPDEAVEWIVDADVALVGPWTARMLAAANRLRWVHADHGGVNSDLFPEFVRSPVLFSCLKPVFGTAGTETALGAMLMFSRRLNYMVRPPRGPDWQQAQDDILLPKALSGKTLGIVGIGHMGQALSRWASCLGLRVVAAARRARTAPPGVERMFTPDRLQDLLRMSDYVVVAVPQTEATVGMVGETFLSHMKETAFLIDLSGRPPVYDYGAIVRAIEGNRIAGVCLQPSGDHPDLGMPPEDSTFWKRENVVVTPCRVPSQELWELGLDLFFRNMRRLQDGGPLEGLVDKAAGY